MSETIQILRRRYRELADDFLEGRKVLTDRTHLHEFATLEAFLKKFDTLHKELDESITERQKSTSADDRQILSGTIDELRVQLSDIKAQLSALVSEPLLARQNEVFIDFQPHTGHQRGKELVDRLVDLCAHFSEQMRWRRVSQGDIYSGRNLTDIQEMIRTGSCTSRCLRIWGTASYLQFRRLSAKYVDQEGHLLATAIVSPIALSECKALADVDFAHYSHVFSMTAGTPAAHDRLLDMTHVTTFRDSRSVRNTRQFLGEYVKLFRLGIPIDLRVRTVGFQRMSIEDQ